MYLINYEYTYGFSIGKPITILVIYYKDQNLKVSLEFEKNNVWTVCFNEFHDGLNTIFYCIFTVK